jgi:hypothetical protein
MKILFLTLITVAFSINAQVTGELDTTYGAQGLVVTHLINNSTTNLASVVDSQGRLVVLQGLQSGNDYLLFIHRYLANGNEDNTYTPLASDLDEFLIDGDFSLAVDASDGIFLGYSNYTCVAVNTDCQQDIFIKHFDSTGLLTGSQIIAFDFGNTYLRQNDKFADLVYIPDDFGYNTEMLAIAATVDYNNVFDTDFGGVLMNVAFDGALSLRTTFSGDGKATCAFDQDIGHSGVGIDESKAIVLEYGNPLELVIGGSAFEGNGANNDGWNLAFCKLDVLGDNIQSWSTLPLINTFNDVEKLEDMYYSSNGVEKLIVAAKFSNSSDNDFNIGRYLITPSTQWVFDNSFGNSGWASVGFTELFIGNTNDIIETITVDLGNNITAVGNMQWQDNGIDYSKVALTRFDQFGILKTDWAINGTKVHDFSTNNKTQVNDMVYDGSNKEFFLVGYYPNGSVNDAYIANISDKSDLLFLNGFEN